MKGLKFLFVLMVIISMANIVTLFRVDLSLGSTLAILPPIAAVGLFNLCRKGVSHQALADAFSFIAVIGAIVAIPAFCYLINITGPGYVSSPAESWFGMGMMLLGIFCAIYFFPCAREERQRAAKEGKYRGKELKKIRSDDSNALLIFEETSV